MPSVRLERLLPLPRVIVWEALVDPVLVEGWLHPTARLVSGTSQRAFVEPDSADDAVLDVISPVFGRVRVRLGSVAGGPRGESTAVTLEVWPEGHDDTHARWSSRLDRLEELLAGHPVDWSSDGGAGVADVADRPDEPSQMTAH